MSSLRPPEPPSDRRDDIEMETKGNNGTIPGTITKTHELGIPTTQPENVHDILIFLYSTL